MEYPFTKEQFVTIKKSWADKESHSAEDHIIYNAIRGLPLDRGFTPLTLPHKISSNNCDAWNGFNQARSNILYWLRQGSLAAGNFKITYGIEPTEEFLASLKAIPRHE